jgi:DNA polymerase (family 10)
MFIDFNSIDALLKLASSIQVNQDVAEALRELSSLQDNVWKSTAYARASQTIENLDKPITEFEDLKDIPGVGNDIRDEIIELLETGQIEKLEKFRQKGKTGRKFTREQALKLTQKLFDLTDEVGIKYAIVGSLRRKAARIKDVDVIVVDRDFESFKKIVTKISDNILRQGKQEIDFNYNGIDINVRAANGESWGSFLLYFSGSQGFLIYLRQVAKSKGYKLNRYGLFKGTKWIAGRTERDIFQKLGLPYVPPEER